MKKLWNSSMLDDYDEKHVGDWRLIENATYDSRNHVVHLTEDLRHQKGAAIYQRVFNWKEIMIEFDYYMYGGKLVTL
jgi:hypothetical protein